MRGPISSCGPVVVAPGPAADVVPLPAELVVGDDRPSCPSRRRSAGRPQQLHQVVGARVLSGVARVLVLGADRLDQPHGFELAARARARRRAPRTPPRHAGAAAAPACRGRRRVVVDGWWWYWNSLSGSSGRPRPFGRSGSARARRVPFVQPGPPTPPIGVRPAAGVPGPTTPFSLSRSPMVATLGGSRRYGRSPANRAATAAASCSPPSRRTPARRVAAGRRTVSARP